MLCKVRLRTLLVLAVFLVLAAPARSQSPWDEPPNYAKLTSAQRQRLRKREREQADIENLLGRDRAAADNRTRQMLAADLQAFGDPHEELARSAHFASDIFYRLGEYELSADLEQETLRLYTALFGPDNWRVATARMRAIITGRLCAAGSQEAREQHGKAITNYAAAQTLDGQDNEKAIAHATAAIKGFAEVLDKLGIPPSVNPDLESAYRLRGEIYLHDNQFDPAVDDLRTALRIVFARVPVDDGTTFGYGKNHPEHAKVLRLLAAVKLWQAKNFESENLLRQSLEILNLCYPGPHREKVRVLAELGNQYLHLGQSAQAVEVLQEALQIDGQCDDPYPEQAAYALNGLSTAYTYLGRYEEALATLKRAVDFAKKRQISETVTYGRTKLFEGMTLIHLKRFDDAIQSITAATAVMYKNLGKDNPDYAFAAAHLGEAYIEAGRLGDAEPYVTGGFQSLLRTVGPQGSYTTDALVIYEYLLIEKSYQACREGKFDAARAAIRTAVDLRVKMSGAGSFHTKFMRRRLDIIDLVEKLAPQDRLAVVQAQVDLVEADHLYGEDRYAESLKLSEPALAVMQRHIPGVKGFVAHAQCIVGLALGAQGEHRRAVEYLEPAVSQLSEELGDDLAPEVGLACVELGTAALVSGDFDRADAWLTSGESLTRRYFGVRSDVYAETIAARARLMLRSGRNAEAEIAAREAAETFKSTVGKSSPRYIDAKCDLAWVLTQAGEFDEADACFTDLDYVLSARGASSADDPTGAKLREFRVAVRRAALAGYNGKAQEAVDRLQKLVASADKSPAWAAERVFALVQLGAIKLQSHLAHEAAGHLQQAVQLAHENGLDTDAAIDKWLAAAQQWHTAPMLTDDLTAGAEAFTDIVDTLKRLRPDGDYQTRQARLIADELTALAYLSEEKRSVALGAVLDTQQAKGERSGDKFADALGQLDHALATWKSLDIDGWFADAARVRRAELLEATGEYQRAGQAWQEIIAARDKALPGDPWPAAAMIQAAQYALRGANVEAASGWLKQAAPAFKAPGLSTSAACGDLQITWARCHLQAGNLGEAESTIRQAETCLLARQAERPEAYGGLLARKAELLVALGDRDRMTAYARRAHNFAKHRCGEHSPLFAETSLLLGRVQMISGSSSDHGVAVLQVAVDSLKNQFGERSPIHVDALQSRALCLARANRPAEAKPLLAQAAEISRAVLGEKNPLVAERLRVEATAARARGENAQAATLLDESLAMWRDLDDTGQLGYIDALLEAGDLASQTSNSDRALEAYEQAMERSLDFLRRATRAQTEQQQLLLTARLRASLDRYLSLAVGNVPAEKIYDHLLQWKGLQLVHELQVQRARRDPKTAEVVAQWEQATGRLATVATRLPYPEEEEFWKRQVDFLTERRDRLELDFLGASAESPSACPTTAELLASMSETTALVDYLCYRRRQPSKNDAADWTEQSRYLVVLLRPGQAVEISDIGPAESVEADVETWRSLSEEVNRAFTKARQSPNEEDFEYFKKVNASYQEVSVRLREQVWVPVEQAVGDSLTVLFSPDGSLAALPLAAMPQQELDHYLVERHTFVVVPAARLLLQTLKSPQALGVPDDLSVLLFGGIDFYASPQQRVEPLAKLPAQSPQPGQAPTVGSALFGPDAASELIGTKVEVDALGDEIARQRPRAVVDKFTGDAGTENAFRRQVGRHRWLHLATHGFFLNELQADAHEAREVRGPLLAGQEAPMDRELLPEALFSPDLTIGLTFAGANQPNDRDEDDGILWGLEVTANDLTDVDLVVLSCCQTASGRVAPGEGTLSLRRAFQLAGAHTIVSTLWSVDDMGTNLFMRRFYHNMLAQGMSKAEALRETQLWFIESARRSIEQMAEVDPANLTIEADALPMQYLLPMYWAPFVMNGDWR